MYFIGHLDWAEHILSPFSYGQTFLDINSTLLKRYAACADAVQMKSVEDHWMEKLEREFAASREADADGDLFAGGNPNRRDLVDSEDEDEEDSGHEEGEENGVNRMERLQRKAGKEGIVYTGDGSEDDDESEDGMYLGRGEKRELTETEKSNVADHGDDEEEEEKDPFAISDDSGEEEEMAELRRKVLASKPFTNVETDERPKPERISKPETRQPEPDSDNPSDDGDDDEFDNIINATPVLDRSGLQAKQRLKGYEQSATFSRTVVGAPKKR
jgi:pre-rRNA-processing protein TSR3